MRNKYYGNSLMGEEGDGSGGGGAAPAPAPAPSPAPGGAEATPAPAPAPTGSALAAGAPADPAANLQPHERFAEKHRVFKEDGTFDLESTSYKAAEAYSALEKKLGTGEVAPATVDEYKVADIGEMTAAEIMGDPITKSFLARAHAKGMTNAQVQDVLDFAMKDWLPAVFDSQNTLTEEACVTELKGVWNTDEAYKANMAGAFKAFQAFADPADISKMDEIGNHPVVIRLLANISREMGEDKGANPGALTHGTNVTELMASAAYTDPKHPEHAAVSAKVKAYYDSKHGTAAAM